MRNSRGLGCLLLVVTVAAVLVVSFAIFALFDLLQRRLLLGGEDWLFFEPAPYAMKLTIFPVVILLMEAGMALSYRISGAGFMKEAQTFMRLLWKYKVPATVLCVVLLYVGFTGINSADVDGVTVRSALNPAGRHYDMELISSVDTGFRRNHEFYYNINVDGRTLKFNAPTANYEKYPEYDTEAYKEFVDFDAKLMALGVPKNADTESLKYAEFDESCMKYLRQVVE